MGVENKETLTSMLYIKCADMIEKLQVNEFGLPITDEQILLYKSKTKEAKNVLNGGTSATLTLEAELTNDTLANLSNTIVYKESLYNEQLNLIEVVRRVIAERISSNDLINARLYLDKFEAHNTFLNEQIVRSILT